MGWVGCWERTSCAVRLDLPTSYHCHTHWKRGKFYILRNFMISPFGMYFQVLKKVSRTISSNLLSFGTSWMRSSWLEGKFDLDRSAELQLEIAFNSRLLQVVLQCYNLFCPFLRQPACQISLNAQINVDPFAKLTCFLLWEYKFKKLEKIPLEIPASARAQPQSNS